MTTHSADSTARRSVRLFGKATLERRLDDGTLLAAAALIAFLGLWGSVLIGHRVLLGGDILESFPPWSGPDAGHPRNSLVADPVTQFLPWLSQVRESLLHFHLPLWTDTSFSGAPLLANQQSATFSPFTIAALPFSPAMGYSLAMLAKLLVAGAGMFTFLRLLGARGLAAASGGIAYATCSFMVVWLAHPHTAVMAIIVWGFAAAEWFVRSLKLQALAALATLIGLQFLAGHAETSLHMGLALGVYAVVRAATRSERRVHALAGIAVAGGLGLLLAAVQLLPFVAELRASTLYQDRLSSGAGFAHLQLSELASWIVPNGHGNPGIDLELGRPPNYNESTGFVGVTILLLAPAGAWWLWRRLRSAAAALVGITAVAAGIVYGQLTPISGRLPLLSTANGARTIAVLCFGLAALGGLGVEALASMRPRLRLPRVSAALAMVGIACVGVLGFAALMVLRRRAEVDTWFGTVNGNIGFWVGVAAVTAIGAVAFVATAIFGDRARLAAGGAGLLVLAEAVLFAGPFQPKVPPDEVPPASSAVAWLQAHAGDASVGGYGFALIPNLSSLYALHDVRGYDLFLNPRLRDYWQHADPGYHDEAFYTLLSTPSVPWLAAAGVKYWVSPPGGALPGTTPVYTDPSTEISEIPDSRPFAFSTVDIVSARDEAAAVTALAAAPLGPIVVEGGSARTNGTPGMVRVDRRDPGAIDLTVEGPSPSMVVVLESWDSDWRATVDGSSVPIAAADVQFQAVSVPAGHHTVALRYEPRTVVVGAALSGVGFIGLAGLISWPIAVRARARRRARPPS